MIPSVASAACTLYYASIQGSNTLGGTYLTNYLSKCQQEGEQEPDPKRMRVEDDEAEHGAAGPGPCGPLGPGGQNMDENTAGAGRHLQCVMIVIMVTPGRGAS